MIVVLNSVVLRYRNGVSNQAGNAIPALTGNLSP